MPANGANFNAPAVGRPAQTAPKHLKFPAQAVDDSLTVTVLTLVPIVARRSAKPKLNEGDHFSASSEINFCDGRDRSQGSLGQHARTGRYRFRTD
jgi:hypothetical protein